MPPQVVSEDEFGTTLLDESGRLVVVPRGILAPGAPPQAAPLATGSSAPPPPDPGDAIGMVPGAPLSAAGIAPGTVAPGTSLTFAPTQLPGKPAGRARPAPRPVAAPDPVEPRPPKGAAAKQTAPADAFETAKDETLGAFDDAETAAARKGEIDAQEQDEIAGTLQARNDRIAEIEDERLKQQEADKRRLAELDKTYNEAVDAEADFKVDENRRFKNATTGYKVRATIGMILAGIGMALKGKGEVNPVIDRLLAEQERDVQQQMDEHDAQIKRIGLIGTQQDRFRQLSGERLAQFNLRMATEAERTARDLEVSAAQYGSPRAKAAATEAAAELRAKRGAYIEQAAQSQWNRDLQERQLRESVAARRSADARGWAAIKQGAEQFDRSMAMKEKELLRDAAKLEQQGNVEAAKLLREQAKSNRELSVGGRSQVTGIDKNNQPVISTTPLAQDDGSVFLAPDETSARAIRKQKAATDTVVQFLDDTKRLLKDGRPTDVLQSAEWQQIQSNKAMIANSLRVAYEMGALDKGALEQMEKMLGGAAFTGGGAWLRDFSGVGASPAAGLDQVRRQVLAKFNSELRANNYTGESYEIPDTAAFEPARDTEAGKAYKAVVGDRTPDEQAADDEPGVITKVGAAVLSPLSDTPREQRPERIREAAGGAYASITPGQETNIRTLIAKAKAGDTEAAKGLAALAQSDRAGLARGTLDMLGDSGDPRLLATVVANLPDSTREAHKITIDRAAANNAAIAADIDLERRARAGDMEALNALVPVARGGGPRAKWAEQILQAAAGGQ